MNNTILTQLRVSAQQTTALANMIMSNPAVTHREFHEAFIARDIAYVEAQNYSEEQLAEIRWETGCGCNGHDSPFHTYFGMGPSYDYDPDEEWESNNEPEYDYDNEDTESE